ncbi:protein of unknown function [Candidatus Promineifilum breve]|uniref:Uncharacterized protein n=1 Tax=Candidatus Promineifilum breve TaxID=1806508 RepID=A0A160T3J7_9CHLR|nr:protein of unknown function [Candidatus Promineifilum breve]
MFQYPLSGRRLCSAPADDAPAEE